MINYIPFKTRRDNSKNNMNLFVTYNDENISNMTMYQVVNFDDKKVSLMDNF